ncbi:hypothetical protein J2Z21_000023 [Streptomyces griseochromogenes]|uniref:Uncharacterized protein n=1 Tax=Streptomyces griseochromogenes TaxID=68214 RepID=A0ABS4LIN8_9ACTN|nr:hypothetical protein [Streptomyces griseochromogenes]
MSEKPVFRGAENVARMLAAIRSVSNPDKLAHVGPVADAWAILRETQQARRGAE